MKHVDPYNDWSWMNPLKTRQSKKCKSSSGFFAPWFFNDFCHIYIYIWKFSVHNWTYCGYNIRVKPYSGWCRERHGPTNFLCTKVRLCNTVVSGLRPNLWKSVKTLLQIINFVKKIKLYVVSLWAAIVLKPYQLAKLFSRKATTNIVTNRWTFSSHLCSQSSNALPKWNV